MGCDIHGMFEYRDTETFGPESKFWVNAGDPHVGRQYWLFGIIAGVRGEDYPQIQSTPIIRDDAGCVPHTMCSDAFHALCEIWDTDGHTAASVTLAQLEAYDTSVFEGAEWATQEWTRIVDFGEAIRTLHKLTDADVRWVFFFDN